MSEEPRDKSDNITLEALRGQNTYQEADSFPDAAVEDKKGGRREATSAEKERMDRDLEKLGDIFAGSSARWQLDGAVNISLMKGGDYIGAHKDTDLTLEPDDLQSLEGHLFQKGYGLFLSMGNPEDQGKKIMKWVSSDEFKKDPDGHLILAAIDEKGKIKKDDSLSFIDVHLVKRNQVGKPVGFYGAELPEQWYEPQWVGFHDRDLALSPPAKVAYFKLFAGRSVDQDDLRKLSETGKLSETDLVAVETAVNKGFENRSNGSDEIIARIAERITNRLGEKDIEKIVAEDPALSSEVSEAQGKRIKILASAVAKLKNRTPENIKKAADKVLGFTAEEKRIKKLIKMLRQK